MDSGGANDGNGEEAMLEASVTSRFRRAARPNPLPLPT